MMEYHGSEPYSFGGRNIAYEHFNKKEVDKTLHESDIYIQDFNNIKNQENSHQYMYIENENYFNRMLYFSQTKI